MSNAQTLRDNLNNLNARDRDFADSLLGQLAKYGSISPKQTHWVEVLAERATAQAPGTSHAVNVGNVAPIIELFKLAGRKLKWPKIKLHTHRVVKDESGNDKVIFEHLVVLKRAGNASKYVGQIQVTDGKPFGQNVWYGRIDVDGTFYPNTRVRQENRKHFDEVVTLLTSFAEDPAGIGAFIGKRTGHCVFCSRELTDARSTTVGYGPVCAGHYGLPWGEAEDDGWDEFIEADEADHRAEAEASAWHDQHYNEEPF
jgi:hypothetical protein